MGNNTKTTPTKTEYIEEPKTSFSKIAFDGYSNYLEQKKLDAIKPSFSTIAFNTYSQSSTAKAVKTTRGRPSKKK